MGNTDAHFEAVDSHRIRVGARLTHKVNERNSFYGGLAYQYEFNGDARATFNGMGAPSPSVKGSSGMLEIGWQVKLGDGPLTLDLGFTGWAGKQKGGSVQLGATWSF
ncbi:MAG: autotransporter domain-containing protein [Schwartzia sp.]|nr:autotransporter domain-containing protein [Schwartzia sp. (in: firmicutes)]